MHVLRQVSAAVGPFWMVPSSSQLFQGRGGRSFSTIGSLLNPFSLLGSDSRAQTNSLGIYFGYNIIGATAPVLQAPPYSLDAKAIGSLAAAYSLPNIAMPLFGGAVTDRLGACVSTQIFSALVLLGSLGFWAAVSAEGLSPAARQLAMFGSMVVFGVGGESLTVAQKSMLAAWFKGSAGGFPRLATATGLALTFGYVAVIVNRWVVPGIVLHSVWVLMITFLHSVRCNAIRFSLVSHGELCCTQAKRVPVECRCLHGVLSSVGVCT
eukprot:SAG22_NODE_1907_length_3332_cov_2.201361_2_plen_265_part_01